MRHLVILEPYSAIESRCYQSASTPPSSMTEVAIVILELATPSFWNEQYSASDRIYAVEHFIIPEPYSAIESRCYQSASTPPSSMTEGVDGDPILLRPEYISTGGQAAHEYIRSRMTANAYVLIYVKIPAPQMRNRDTAEMTAKT